MDKSLLERIAALKAKASGDPKGVDSIVDAVSPDDAFIQKVVEKIMSKMDAEDGAGKYKVDAHGTNKKQAALDRAVALLKQAFDMPGAPAADPVAPSPMDAAFGETPATENADAGMPEMAPVKALEDEAHKYGDPALDALVNVIEMLIKKDMGVKDHSTEAPAKGAPAPFGGADDEEVEEDAAPSPFGGDDAAPKAEAPAKKSPPKAEKSDEGEDDKSEPEDDKSEEKDEEKEEKNAS